MMKIYTTMTNDRANNSALASYDAPPPPAAATTESVKATEIQMPLLRPALNNNNSSKLFQEQQQRQHYEDTRCGISFVQGEFIQKFAKRKIYISLYGALGCLFMACSSYASSTFSTMEKRFKIPSKAIGVIAIGNDISQIIVSIWISYYADKHHRPRWIAIGVYLVACFCFINVIPHLLYGPGENALLLTKEYGANSTQSLSESYKKALCTLERDDDDCIEATGSHETKYILFIAQFILGIGNSLFSTLGISYMDDNTQRAKTPIIISFTYFLRMLGPVAGYGLSTITLKYYISPNLTPIINKTDPRWLGAWWSGWIILAVLLIIFGSIIALFPRALPETVASKAASNKKINDLAVNEAEDEKASFGDLWKTFKRLLRNKALMCNNIASVFYILGYSAYMTFMPKYIEIQYKQSASAAALLTGSSSLFCSAIGILGAGAFIQTFRPKARSLAFWNVLVGVTTVVAIIGYASLGCPAVDQRISLSRDGSLMTELPCNQNCNCDYITYNPVCAEDGQTFISACHAGCSSFDLGHKSGGLSYTNCSCVASSIPERKFGGSARLGPCPLDCTKYLKIFIAIVCVVKLIGASGRTSNFLVSVRCVSDKDKSMALGAGLSMMSLLAFIPAPILFGYIYDYTCVMWGKTCGGNGNCWLYNASALRSLVNYTAAGFVSIGVCFDVGVWYYVKNVKVFEEEEEHERGVEMETVN
ncbi:solute carrier organic anion transporter family member 2A1 isoform X1 [Trichogramma pretiosum]|uniref:solute carrier organic anion transporter family member 2A1 isoform X1 n=2 Tax=Trichogramma pretiosum TaxID=7493 RepID=UPI0006C9A9E9|nr:solute carrier organic anion transporter family member 2A1 isoform X1 [Trichogramma pretiosum]